VHSLPVGEKDDSEYLSFGLGDRQPAPNPTVCLNHLADWCSNCALNPVRLNHGSIGALPNRLEVRRGLHRPTLPELCHASKHTPYRIVAFFHRLNLPLPSAPFVGYTSH
jgi:hypothetical protein